MKPGEAPKQGSGKEDTAGPLHILIGTDTVRRGIEVA